MREAKAMKLRLPKSGDRRNTMRDEPHHKGETSGYVLNLGERLNSIMQEAS